MSRLEIANRFLFQWFFVRLARFSEPEPDENFQLVYKSYQWAIIGFILPCTGWSSDYFYTIKKFIIKLSKKRPLPVSL